MVIVDELNQANVVQMDLEELLVVLDSIKRAKVDEIGEIRMKIVKFEEKRRAEDVKYQSLSPIKKLFTSRAPSHHQAVEYMVYVKERFKSIENIKKYIANLEKMYSYIHSEPNTQEIIVSGVLMNEIKSRKEAEVGHT